jgi:hypothetical protein
MVIPASVDSQREPLNKPRENKPHENKPHENKPHENKEPAMAQKSRTIHPADAQDERLANLPLSAAYTYAYLPTILDDEGRAKDQPSVFNGYLWPLRA